MDFDFEQEMEDLHVTPTQMAELRTAYRQSPEGFELVFARTSGADVPRAALVTKIRNGSHLRAGGIRQDERKTPMFVCNFCGALAHTTAENHYNNFPEHRDGKPAVVVYQKTPSQLAHEKAQAKPAT